jgi:hypothetical protein
MVTSVRWKWFLLPILGIALLAGGLVVHVEGGKPKPPPPAARALRHSVVDNARGLSPLPPYQDEQMGPGRREVLGCQRGEPWVSVRSVDRSRLCH